MTECPVVEEIQEDKKQTIFTKLKELPVKTKQTIAIVCGMVVLLGFGIFWFVHPHSYGEWQIVKQPTCLEDGLQEKKCFCGKKETKSLAATGHNEVIDSAVAPTCVEPGLTEGSHCSNCELVFVEQQTLEPVGHMMGHIEAIAPTCTDAE